MSKKLDKNDVKITVNGVSTIVNPLDFDLLAMQSLQEKMEDLENNGNLKTITLIVEDLKGVLGDKFINKVCNGRLTMRTLTELLKCFKTMANKLNKSVDLNELK